MLIYILVCKEIGHFWYYESISGWYYAIPKQSPVAVDKIKLWANSKLKEMWTHQDSRDSP